MRETRRNVLLALGVVGVSSVAGCSSTGGNTQHATSISGTGTGTPPQDGTPSQQSISYPPGFTKNGITSIEKAIESHKQFLLKIPNYTKSVKIKYTGDESGTPTVSRSQVDTEAKDILIRYTDHAHNKEFFFNSGAFYGYDHSADSRVNMEERLLFKNKNTFQELVTTWVDMLLVKILEYSTFSRAGVVSRDDRSLIRYTVSGLSNQGKKHIKSMSGTLLVTSTGGIVSLDVEAEGSSVTQTISYHIQKIGETTVSRPQWLQ